MRTKIMQAFLSILVPVTIHAAEPANYETWPDSGQVVIDRVYESNEVRLFYEDISLCVETPSGTFVLWSAPEPVASNLSPNGMALVKLQAAVSELYPEKGMSKDSNELSHLRTKVQGMVEVDSIVPYGPIYKVYFKSDDGIPTYWESFIRAPFPERYKDDLKAFALSTDDMRDGIRRHLRILIDRLRKNLDEGCLVVLWPRERQPGIEVIDDNLAEALGEVSRILEKRPVALRILSEEAAEAVGRW